MCRVSIERTATGTTSCESGDYHEDAKDLAEIAAIASHAAMHAISTGHTVHEHTSLCLTVRPCW
jgi:hypothetical protein